MIYNTLGKTGLKISAMGFGGIPIQRIDAAGTGKLMQLLKESGINYIDTARGYTVSEEFIGEALEGIRDAFILATKSMARDKVGMARDIDISLRNLRTDHIDLYQVHNPNEAALKQVTAPGGALEALLEAKAAGKIKHIGITLHSVKLFEQALEMDWVETIMYPYSLIETQAEELIARCAEKNIGFIAMKPLAGGAIDDATLAMRFVSRNPNVSVVIPGMAEEKEICENLAAVNDPAPLTDGEWDKIYALRKSLGTQFCRRCNYCAPCTAGIAIPNVFMMEGYYSRYDLKDWAKGRYFAMDRLASDCVACGVCEERCPYQLPIRQMMQKAAMVFGK